MSESRFGPFVWKPTEKRLHLLGAELPLSTQEASILATLAERVNSPVATQRLLSIDGGQPEPKALWEAVGRINEILAARSNANCFVAHHPSDGFSLVVESGARHRVIGRDEIIGRIGNQLATHRFVTILGPGGMGKTTVARRVADTFSAAYPDGVHVADLSRLADGRLIATAVGAAMGLALTGPDPLAGLAAFVRQKRVLLLLDSCEHMTEGAARVAEAMLAAGEGVRVLATSREPLLAAGERLMRLPALDTGTAVDLFVQRVCEREPAFEPGAQDLELIGAICDRLDGLPLAIEIVAARASELGLVDLSRQLDERLLFVEGAVPHAPARHQTLAATMDWSYDQLGTAERAALRRLSIFRGKFPLAAAEAVVSAPDLGAHEAGGAVIDLVDRSLLSRMPSGAFRMLDTTRVYAASKLMPGELAAVSRRHARYLLAVLRRAESDWQTMDVRAWQLEYGEWIDDLRLALAGCFGEHGDELLGVELAFAGFELGRQLSLDVELRRYMQRALDVLGQQPARDYVTEITLKAYLGSMGQVIDLDGAPQQSSLEEMLAQEGSRISARVQIIAIGSINHGALMSADFATAKRWADRAIEAARDSGDEVAASIAERMNAQARHFMGEHAEAEQLALSVLAARGKIPLTYIPSPVEPRVSMRLLLARVHWMQGKASSAAKWADECMQHAETDTAISRCQALAMCAIPLAIWSREYRDAKALTARLQQLAERYSLGYWAYWAERVELALAAQTLGADAQPDARLFKSGPSEANLRDHLCTFHPQLMGDDVWERAESGLVGWCAPEAYRARAVSLMNSAKPDLAVSERLLRSAVDLSRKQGALAWELRASTTLAQLLSSTSRASEARVRLRATLGRFEEGADSVDLSDARIVLAGLTGLTGAD